MKKDEYEKLIVRYGEADTLRMIEKLNYWKLDKQSEAEQKKGSDYAKIYGWVAKWLSEEKSKIEKVNTKIQKQPIETKEPIKDYSETSF